MCVLALLYIILMEVLDQDSLCAHIKELKIKSYKQLCVCVCVWTVRVMFTVQTIRSLGILSKGPTA